MSGFVESLALDHQRMARLMFALKAEIDRIGAEDCNPDWRRLLAILDYLSDYPERWHHPLEERAFEAVERDALPPEAAEALDRVRDQHQRLPALTGKLREDVESVLRGSIVPTDRFVEDANAYLGLQIEHMRLENEIVFPALERALGSEAMERLEDAMRAPPDDRFEHLYYELLEADHARRTG